MYVEGINDGKMIVHAGGWKARLPAILMQPDSSLSVEATEDRSVVRLAGFVDDPERLEREFRAALLDDALRARIEAETAPLRRLIVEAALRSALRDPDADA